MTFVDTSSKFKLLMGKRWPNSCFGTKIAWI